MTTIGALLPTCHLSERLLPGASNRAVAVGVGSSASEWPGMVESGLSPWFAWRPQQAAVSSVKKLDYDNGCWTKATVSHLIVASVAAAAVVFILLL